MIVIKGIYLINITENIVFTTKKINILGIRSTEYCTHKKKAKIKTNKQTNEQTNKKKRQKNNVKDKKETN